MSRGDLTGIIVGCSIAVIGVIGLTVTGTPAASTPTYTLSVSVNPAGGGSVSTSGGEYRSGAQVLLTASPATGYAFDRWSGSASGTTPIIMITMSSDKSVTAHFRTTQTASQILFSDDFTDEASGWDTYSAEYGSVFYRDGWLHLINNNPADFATGTWAGKHFTDFVLEVETKLVAGTDNNWHIVACRYQDSHNSYRFGISADGYYFVYKVDKGDWIRLASTTYSSSINQGVGAINLIRIECVGSNLGLSVNGHMLWQGTDTTFTGGDIVLVANAVGGTFTEIAFDNLVISRP